ncbi:uncharacterized protein J8A68_000799 [[Candida] subhashii]|uniref:C2H2-type domain-containing protein n=1 Tax=[Candida] subhashii TaxID=561895 RepID=A0A8J5QPZ4_9ASCO|nr:uncharacterized protein J8A68_000799 [[Candida] subhashii]KAG7665593.1 hypothetical protein J8A68_000799 [[Candida] subhashii]
MATQKKYICAFCARAFTRSEHKQRHERSHTNEKPFHCLHCTSSFVRRDLLQRHCRTVHNSQLNPNTLPSNKSLNNPTSHALTVTSTSGSTSSNSSDSLPASPTNQSMVAPPPPAAGQHGGPLIHHQIPQPLLAQRSPTQFNQKLHQQLAAATSQNHFSLGYAEAVLDTPMTPANTRRDSISTTTSTTANKRRKKSVVEDTFDHSHHSHSAHAKDLASHDLIHLLSITKKLENTLIKFDPTNANHSLSDHFLIGYITLSKSAKKEYKIFDKILKDLIYNLNSFYNNSNGNNSQNGMTSPKSGGNGNGAGGEPNNFKIGIIYSIISLGFIMNKNPSRATRFFKKSWNLLIKKLIPQYNNNNNLLDQIGILTNLFMLSYIYLNYDLESYNINENDENDMVMQSMDDNEGEVYINNEVILNYLNDISFIIISNLKDLNSANDNLVDLNINLFWTIYIMLSTYIKQTPPKIYSFFFNKIVKGNETLLSLMNKFSKSFINMDSNASGSNNDEFLKMIIVTTLSNELKRHTNGEVAGNNHEDIPLLYESKNCLHNSIILINKSINFHSTIHRSSSEDDSDTSSSAIKLFELFKKNIIINSPLKFHELLNNYLFIPSKYYNWELLSLTLQEINMNSPLSRQLILDTIGDPNLTPNLESSLRAFFNFKTCPLDINNNLSIISYPLVFFANYLNLGLVDLSGFNFLELTQVNLFMVEWYCIMHKVLIMIWSNHELFDENYVLSNLIYLLLDNKGSLLHKLNLENSSSIGLDRGNDGEEFQFNQKWFWILKLKFQSIFETWLNFIKLNNNSNVHFNNNLSILKLNISKFINEYLSTEGLKFIVEEESQQITPPIKHQSQPHLQQHQSQPQLQQQQMSFGMTPTSSSNYIPLQQQPSYNFSTSTTFPDYDPHSRYTATTMGPSTTSKRSNSITLGLLAQTIQDEARSPMTGALSTSSSASSIKPPAMSHHHSISSMSGITMQSSNSGGNGNGGNNGGKMSYYSNYSTYPPPPPILSSMNSGSSGVGGNKDSVLLLPPILASEGSNSGAGGRRQEEKLVGGAGGMMKKD